MKAATYYRYGPPSVLQIEDIPRPKVGEREMLIRVVASTLNSGDCRLRKADPFMVRLFFGLSKPRIRVLGTVFSGVIQETGPQVSKFKVGDAVFGLSDEKMGAHAEYISFPENLTIARKPEGLTHTEAAALVFGGHTALHFLRQADLKHRHLMIYGASGAVGTSAVQIAKHYGAHVTGVCSGRNVDLVKSLGADEVIDYTSTDIYKTLARFDVIFETVGKTSIPNMARLLKPKGTLLIGSAMLAGMLQGSWTSSTRGVRVVNGVAKGGPEDLELLAHLSVKGELDPVIDRSFPLEEIQAAHEYVDTGHKAGNVLIDIAG